MNIPESLTKLVGKWAGTNQLWLAPGEPARLSASTAEVALAAQGKFLTLRYTWADGGAPQDGLIVLGHELEAKAASAFWIDSWHMQDKSMACRGTIDALGNASVKGAYAAPPGPDWGWQIDIVPASQDAFDMVMYNITPNGEATIAVKTAYARQS